MVSDTEDGKEARQGRVSHREGSTAENNRNMSHREDGKEAAQGGVSHRERLPTEKIENKKHNDEYHRGKVPQLETKRYILDREKNERENNSNMNRCQQSFCKP